MKTKHRTSCPVCKLCNAITEFDLHPTHTSKWSVIAIGRSIARYEGLKALCSSHSVWSDVRRITATAVFLAGGELQ